MNFIARSNVFLSFEFEKRWSSLFDNVTTRYELWAGRQLKGKICQNNSSFTAQSNYAACTEKQRAQKHIQIINNALFTKMIAHC